MSRFVQIYPRLIRVERVERGSAPNIDVVMQDHERVVSVRLARTSDDLVRAPKRKTVDYTFEIWIEADLKVDGI